LEILLKERSPFSEFSLSSFHVICIDFKHVTAKLKKIEKSAFEIELPFLKD
jgi:hypothetical protein